MKVEGSKGPGCHWVVTKAQGADGRMEKLCRETARDIAIKKWRQRMGFLPIWDEMEASVIEKWVSRMVGMWQPGAWTKAREGKHSSYSANDPRAIYIMSFTFKHFKCLYRLL